LYLVAQVAAAQAVQQTEVLEQLTLAAAVVGALETQEELLRVGLAVQALLLFLTLALNVAQAAQSHQAVATPFIHLQHLARTPHKDYHGTFCKSSRRKSDASHCCRT
jgi:hypothetical protein